MAASYGRQTPVVQFSTTRCQHLTVMFFVFFMYFVYNLFLHHEGQHCAHEPGSALKERQGSWQGLGAGPGSNQQAPHSQTAQREQFLLHEHCILSVDVSEQMHIYRDKCLEYLLHTSSLGSKAKLLSLCVYCFYVVVFYAVMAHVRVLRYWTQIKIAWRLIHMNANLSFLVTHN